MFEMEHVEFSIIYMLLEMEHVNFAELIQRNTCLKRILKKMELRITVWKNSFYTLKPISISLGELDEGF